MNQMTTTTDLHALFGWSGFGGRPEERWCDFFWLHASKIQLSFASFSNLTYHSFNVYSGPLNGRGINPFIKLLGRKSRLPRNITSVSKEAVV